MKEPHVLWVDNFSKVFRKSIPTVDRGTYNSCLWTGYAAFVIKDSIVQTSLLTDHNRQIIYGMPNDLCSVDGVRRVKEGIAHVHSDIRSHYERSLVLQYDICNIPPKIDTKVHVDMKDVVDHKKNSTENVHPVKLFKKNIGSNEGLVSVLSDIAVTYGMVDGSCNDYVMLNVDENIYWRIMKVIHNNTSIFGIGL